MRGGCRRHLERCRTRCALRVDDSHPAYAARTSCTQEIPTAAAWTRGVPRGPPACQQSAPDCVTGERAEPTAMSGRRNNSRELCSTLKRRGALVLYAGASVILLYAALVQMGGRAKSGALSPTPTGAFKGTISLDAATSMDAVRDEQPARTPRSKRCLAQLSQVQNPILSSAKRSRVRDPAVQVLDGGVRELYYTFYEGEPKKMWSDTTGYTVQVVTTTDWRTFSSAEPVTPTGYCSPDAPVEWRGSTLLAQAARHTCARGSCERPCPWPERQCTRLAVLHPLRANSATVAGIPGVPGQGPRRPSIGPVRRAPTI